MGSGLFAFDTVPISDAASVGTATVAIAPTALSAPSTAEVEDSRRATRQNMAWIASMTALSAWVGGKVGGDFGNTFGGIVGLVLAARSVRR